MGRRCFVWRLRRFLWTGQAAGALAALDALLPGVVFGLMMASLADFGGGPGFGSLTAVPWGVTQYGVRRHPVQLYELFVGALALLAWWRCFTSPPTM
ncbi:MAG: prolipoprotein diacylglyceryl transferase [Ardenticatenaceae bacterium]|nr:prolipoprotein diacylglyceryl transferase [Ardenticatenaceae bacterium]